MICRNCGKIVESGAAFCTNCGTKLAAPIEPTEKINTADNSSFSAAASPSAFDNDGGIYEKQPAASEMSEKTYFGKGALVFCLVVIGLLAISTGVFAGLYLSAV